MLVYSVDKLMKPSWSVLILNLLGTILSLLTLVISIRKTANATAGLSQKPIKLNIKKNLIFMA